MKFDSSSKYILNLIPSLPLIIYKRAIKDGGDSPSYKRLAPEREKERHHRFFCRRREAAKPRRTNRHHPRCNRNNNYNPFDDFSSLSTDSLYNVNATGNCWQKIRRTEFRGVERINNEHRNRMLELEQCFSICWQIFVKNAESRLFPILEILHSFISIWNCFVAWRKLKRNNQDSLVIFYA